jgi:phosphoglucosamine mutase
MGKYFGTDGVRGVAGEVLTASLAYKIGLSIKHVLKENKVVIGKDTRASSDMLAFNLAAGALASGVDVYMAGVVSTPMIANISKEENMIGVMVTASHNPFHDNGIKLFNKGYKMLEKDDLKIEAFIDGETPSFGQTFGRFIDYSQFVKASYLKLYEGFEHQTLHLSVGYDSANGANYQIAKEVLEPLCDESYQINADPNGMNINLNAGSTHLEAIKALVKEKALDIGFSFDGDGDRCLVVDHALNVYDGDMIIYALARYLKDLGKLNKNTVVLTKMSNPGILKAFKALGIKTVLTDVGDKYVTSEILKNNYTIGGENSGHIILNHLLHTGDGLLVAVTLLNLLQTLKLPLHKLFEDVTMYPQKMVNIKNVNKTVLDHDLVKKAIKEADKVLGQNRLLLVRASGTEPLIRVTISHEDETLLDSVMDKLVSTIKELGENK